jgi:transmembrane sensor
LKLKGARRARVSHPRLPKSGIKLAERPPSIRVDDLLLIRHLAGETSGAEQAAIRAWIEADPRVREPLLADLAAAAAGMGGDDTLSPGAVNVDAFAARLSARIDAAERLPAAQRRAAPMVRPSVAWRVAAALIVFLGAGVVWRAGWLSRGVAREYVAAVGERVTVDLDDGTEVVLAPASHLLVEPGFAERRRVSIDGEGYFRVRHDAAHPFTVRTRAGTTQDVGTAFDVRQYPDERAARVVVAEGAVLVQRTPVEAGQLAVADGASVAVTPGVDAESYLGWRHGRIDLRDATVAAAIAEIARWYGIRIVLADPRLAARHVTATFDRDTPDEVIRVLSRALDVRATRSGSEVTLTSQP